MKIFHHLTLRTLLKNRTRTAVTIIGVILSAAMITAVTTLVSSTRNYMLEAIRSSAGDWHGVYYAADAGAAEELEQTGQVEADGMSRAQILGYAAPEGIQNPEKPYLYILGGNETFYSDMAIYLIDGRLPQNPAEILLPDHLASNGGLELENGTVLELELGSRVDADGSVLFQTKQLSCDYSAGGEISAVTETLQPRETRYYTVVGHYSRPGWEPYSAPGYTALTVPDDTPAAGSVYDLYFRLKHPTETLDFMSESRSFSYADWDKNTDLLMFYGVSAYAGFLSVVGGFAAILILLIMFGSISLIYNAFSISVSQRTKQFGLLSSVGATRKQLRASVRYEAFLVSLVGIPLGVLCGILGIWVTLQFVGGKFSSSFFNNVATAHPLTLYVSPLAIILAVIIAFVTVLISAHVPARRAMRVTAMEAIRQTQDVRIRARTVKTSRLTEKLFGLEGTLARKNFKRSKKSYRATVVSLFMSIVLFISAGSFCEYLKLSVGGAVASSDYDIRYYLPPAYTSEAMETGQDADAPFQQLAAVEGVERAAKIRVGTLELHCDPADCTDRFREASEHNGWGFSAIGAYLVVVDDASFRSYLEENGLSVQEYMNPQSPKAIATHRMSYIADGRYENFEILQDPQPGPVQLSVWDNVGGNQLSEQELGDEAVRDRYWTDLTLDIGAYVDELSFGANEYTDYGVNILLPESVAAAWLDGAWDFTQAQVNFYFVASDHAAVYERMLTVLEENGQADWRLYDQAADEQTMRDVVTIINVFSYGFIVLISLIALANVFNTISTNIMLRRREFAMLRSVGITRRGLNRMMNYECLLYGFKGLLYGLPVAIFLTWLIFRAATSGYEQQFFIPPVPVIIAVGSVFIVVFATMLYAMRKIKKDNPIDALRSENT